MLLVQFSSGHHVRINRELSNNKQTLQRSKGAHKIDKTAFRRKPQKMLLIAVPVRTYPPTPSSLMAFGTKKSSQKSYFS